MTIYIDPDYKCHVSDDGTMRAFDVPFFDGKCKEFIEGFIYIPSGEKRILPNGTFFRGEQKTPWKDYSQLVKAQAAYETELLKAENEDLKAAIAKFGVTDDE